MKFEHNNWVFRNIDKYYPNGTWIYENDHDLQISVWETSDGTWYKNDSLDNIRSFCKLTASNNVDAKLEAINLLLEWQTIAISNVQSLQNALSQIKSNTESNLDKPYTVYTLFHCKQCGRDIHVKACSTDPKNTVKKLICEWCDNESEHDFSKCIKPNNKETDA